MTTPVPQLAAVAEQLRSRIQARRAELRAASRPVPHANDPGPSFAPDAPIRREELLDELLDVVRHG